MADKKSKKEIFESFPIPKAVAVLAVPTVISQLISIIYNLADTYFVGMLDNPYQVGAINVCLPLMLTFTALANLFGVGGAGVISRLLGKGDTHGAKKVSAFCAYSGITVALVYSALVLIFKETLLYFLGADDTTFTYSESYLFWAIAMGGAVSVLNPLLAHLVRAEGGAFHASIGMSMGAIINIILDPIMILGLGLEVTGAAIATLIGNLCASIYFLIYILRRRKTGVLSLVPSLVSARRVFDVLWTGVPSFFISLLAGISNLGVNNLITHYDSIALAGVGIAKKINLTAFALTQGLSQGCLPLIGYNYSSGNKRRVRDTVIFAGSLGAVITAACMVLALFFPSALVSLFIKHPLTVSYGSEFLRIICLSMPTSTFLFMSITYFQAIGKKTFPLIISLLRKGSIDLVLMYLLDRAMGINGILWATPITETAVSVFCVVSVLIILKKEKNKRSIDN